MGGQAADRFLIVGVVPGQSEKVPLAGARLANLFDAELVCAHVDAMRYVVQEGLDGSVVSSSVDPDVVEEGDEVFDEGLRARLAATFDGGRVRWSTRLLAGEPAVALSHLAERLDAEAIIVGTRRAGFRSGMQEFFGGSVAVRLAHRQGRPVIVVPVGGEPRTATGSILLPWGPADQL